MKLPLPETAAASPDADVQARLVRFVEGRRFSTVVMIAVGLNALVLGLNTYGGLPPAILSWCSWLDTAFLVLFVFELILKLFAWRLDFFRNAWNLFDLVVIVVSLVAIGPFSVLRTLRIFRTLRLVSAVPSMRRVVEALIRAIPGISAILGVMMVFFYVSAVLTTSMFGRDHPEMFGALGTSTVTLFQLMLFDNWGDTLRAVGATHHLAPVFFITFTVVSAFAVLNLFIAVMVDALRTEHDRLQGEDLKDLEHGQTMQQRSLNEVDASVKGLEGKLDIALVKLDALTRALGARQEGDPR